MTFPVSVRDVCHTSINPHFLQMYFPISTSINVARLTAQSILESIGNRFHISSQPQSDTTLIRFSSAVPSAATQHIYDEKMAKIHYHSHHLFILLLEIDSTKLPW